MATYAIGDVQGCYSELLKLLDRTRFDENRDRLWFTGDLVNRGPQSLEVLRFVKALGNTAVTVLGNHDLHLLALFYGSTRRVRKKDTLDAVLAAHDRDQLLEWLRWRPMFHQDPSNGFSLVHAGLAPQWDLAKTRQCAADVEYALRSERLSDFLDNMYGDTPLRWADDLADGDRLRFITNCLTRIRFCDAEGNLELGEKGPPSGGPSGYLPWYEVADRRNRDLRVIFGHWSTLSLADTTFERHNVFPLDTGCVWGGELSALRLEDQRYFQVSADRSKN